jgi:multiple sugar transport system permease protein
MPKDRGVNFVLPALTTLGLVAVLPVFYVFYLSLHRKVLTLHITTFTGFDNYLRLMGDPRFWNSLKNTVYFTGLSVTLEILLGLGIAVLLNRTFRGQGFMRAVVLVPWAVPTVVSAKMWEWIYNTDFGLLNYLVGEKVNWLGSTFWAMNAAVFMDVWKTTPFVALLLIAGLQVIPRDLYHAARVDGAGGWEIFRRITLPLLKPVILIVLVFRTLDAFRVFDAVYVLTGGGPGNTTETLSIYAYKVLFQVLQFGYGSTLAVVVFLCVGLTSVLYVRVLSRSVK